MSDIDQINQIMNQALGEANSPDTVAVPRARMLANIKRRTTAPAPEGTYTVKASDGEWEPFADGIERRVILSDSGEGVETAIYRLEPGAKFLTHEHTHQEACWVVEGDVLVGDHLVQTGEMHVAETGYTHPEIVARTPALLLIRSQVYIGPATSA